MCSNSRQAELRMHARVQLETLWTRADCGSEIAFLLRTRIVGQYPWTDVD